MAKSIFADITAERVKAIRETSGKGMYEVALQLEREAALLAIQRAQHTIALDPELAEVLKWLVERS